jgi:hypothetical protein
MCIWFPPMGEVYFHPAEKLQIRYLMADTLPNLPVNKYRCGSRDPAFGPSGLVSERHVYPGVER